MGFLSYYKFKAQETIYRILPVLSNMWRFLSFWFFMSPFESPTPTVSASSYWFWNPQHATAAQFGSRRGEFVVVDRVMQVFVKTGLRSFFLLKTLSFLFWRRYHCDVWVFHENKYMTMMMMVVTEDGAMKINIQWLMRRQRENANRLNNKETVSNVVWIPTTMDSLTKI